MKKRRISGRSLLDKERYEKEIELATLNKEKIERGEMLDDETAKVDTKSRNRGKQGLRSA